MGQRHNRRRTRPRSRNRATSPETLAYSSVSPHDQNTVIFAPISPVNRPLEAVVLPSLAHTRHHWLGEWQHFERNEERNAYLPATEEYRFFGGEPGDDPDLCYNMLDYFGRLDYINT